jgi:hypothetical protein
MQPEWPLLCRARSHQWSKPTPDYPIHILIMRYTKWSPSFRFSDYNFACISSFSHTLHAPHTSLSLYLSRRELVHSTHFKNITFQDIFCLFLEWFWHSSLYIEEQHKLCLKIKLMGFWFLCTKCNGSFFVTDASNFVSVARNLWMLQLWLLPAMNITRARIYVLAIILIHSH